MAVYTVPFDNLTVTNDSDQDIWELSAPADAAVKIHRIVVNSATTTDERVRLRLIRRTAAGTGGSAATEVPIDGTSAAVGTAVVTLVTTPGTAGDVLQAWYWSQLSPFDELPVPEDRVVVPPSGRVGLNLETAVASSRNWSGYVVFEEIG